MPALVFLVLVGLFAHSVFVPAGPVAKPEIPLPKVVVIHTAGQVIDTWQQKTTGEIIVEVPADVTEVEIEEDTSEEVLVEEGITEVQEVLPAEEEPPVAQGDPVEGEEVIEEAFEPQPIVENPVLVIDEEVGTEAVPETLEQNLVEALIGE